jgi:hypothetical protein
MKPIPKWRNLSDRVIYSCLVKGKAILLQAWTGPEKSRSVRLPYFKTKAHECDKVVSPTHWPPLPPGNILGDHFF